MAYYNSHEDYWTSSLSFSDSAGYWESVFPCDEEDLNPLAKKRPRLDDGDVNTLKYSENLKKIPLDYDYSIVNAPPSCEDSNAITKKMCPDYGDTPWYSDLQLLNPICKKMHLQYDDDVVETP